MSQGAILMESIVLFIHLFIYVSTKSVFNILLGCTNREKILLLNFYLIGLIDYLVEGILFCGNLNFIANYIHPLFLPSLHSLEA